jgi:PAS domain S-box-containing protein
MILKYSLLHYGLALMGGVIGMLIFWTLTFSVGPGLSAYATFFPIIMVVALIGGLGPGLFATCIMALAINYWFFAPSLFPSMNNPVGVVDLIYFILAGVLISAIAGRYRYAQRHIEKEVDRAKGKLLKSEEKYYSLFQNSPLPIWEENFSEVKKRLDRLKKRGITDIGKYLEENLGTVSELASCIKIEIANNSALTFFKARDNDEFKNKFSEIFRKRTLELYRRQITDFYAGKKNFWCEGIARTLAGESKYIDMNLSVLDGHETELDKIIVSTVDITERKKAERELKANQIKMIKAEEIAYMGSWEIDLVNELFYWSDGVYKIFGLQPQEFTPTYKSFLAAIHPDDRLAVDMAYFDSLAEEKKGYEIEHRIVKRPAGEVRIIQQKCEHVRDESGKVIKSLGVVQDVTEDRKIEEELRRTRYYLESLFDNANAPIIVWSPEFKITKFNHAFERLTGYKENDVINKDLSILFPSTSKEESLAKINQTLIGGHLEAVEIPIENQNGEVRTVLWNSANIYDQSGKKIIATIAQGQDITKLKEIDKAKSEFISMASHQLRTPLSSISLSSDLLLRGITGNLEGEQKDFIKEIFLSAQRMSNIISDLLSVTKIEFGVYEIRRQNFNTAEFINDLLNELNLQVIQKRLTLERKYLPEGLEINFDKNIFMAIVENLISNAIQYTPAGGKITVTIENTGKGILITIADTGLGMDKNEQDKVFNKFFRAKKSNEIYPNGSGLGLYIVKSFADKTGVKIQLESEVGKGSTFNVLFPKN